MAAHAFSSASDNWCTVLFFILPVYERTKTQEQGQSRPYVHYMLMGMALYLALKVILK